MGIFARLGHVILIFGFLISAIILLFLIVTLGPTLWDDASLLLILFKYARWGEIADHIVPRLVSITIALVIALIPLLLGAACCYVLGGFGSSR